MLLGQVLRHSEALLNFSAMQASQATLLQAALFNRNRALAGLLAETNAIKYGLEVMMSESARHLVYITLYSTVLSPVHILHVYTYI